MPSSHSPRKTLKLGLIAIITLRWADSGSPLRTALKRYNSSFEFNKYYILGQYLKIINQVNRKGGAKNQPLLIFFYLQNSSFFITVLKRTKNTNKPRSHLKFNWQNVWESHFLLLSLFYPRVERCSFWFWFHKSHRVLCSYINRIQGFCLTIGFRCYRRAKLRLWLCFARIWRWQPVDWYFWVDLSLTFWRCLCISLLERNVLDWINWIIIESISY